MKKPQLRSVKVEPHRDLPGSWVVSYFLDGKWVGGAVFGSPEEADSAAADFMFGGDL